MSTNDSHVISRRQAAALATALLLAVATAGAAITGMAHTPRSSTGVAAVVATPAPAPTQPAREADD